MKRNTIALAALTLAFTLVGCAALAKQAFQNPVVEFKDAQLRGIGIAGGSADIILDVMNPNDYRIDATKISYTFFVEDTVKVATGVIDQMVNLPKEKATTVTIPVSFTFAEITKAVSRIQRTGSVNYSVTGDFTVATPFGSFTRPYTGRGRFNSADLLRR